MRSYTKKDFFDWRIMILSILLYFIHIISIKNVGFGFVIFGIENIILLYSALKKRLDIFLYSLSFILPVTFDITAFISEDLEESYSIVNLPYLKGYLFIIISLSFLSKVFIRSKLKYLLFNSPYSFFSKFVIYLFLLGVISGIITMIFDDVDLLFRIRMWYKHLISIGMFSLLSVYYVYEFQYNNKFYYNIRVILFSSIIAIVFSTLISAIIGLKGSYGGEDIVLAPLSFFFSILVLIFLFFNDYSSRYKILLGSVVLLSLYLQFNYSNALGGKSWLALFFEIIFVLILLFKKNVFYFFFVVVSFIAFVIPLALNFIDNQDNDSLSSKKFTQAYLLISAVDVDLYENIPTSPRMRIEEFLNTLEEYKRKPYYAVFGKGFGGGHRDYRLAYDLYNASAFTDDQYTNKYFVFTHETFNGIFLRSGFYGLIMLIILFIKCFKQIDKTPWIVLGIFWINLFWGYSYSLLSIGLPSLLLGYYIPNDDF